MDDITQRNIELHLDDMEIASFLREIAVFTIEGLGCDGAHHKRWVAQEILRKIQFNPLVMREPGVAP